MMTTRSRLFVILMAAGVLCPIAGAQEQARLEPLYRAAKQTQSAVKAGVTNPRLRELVEQFQAELSVADDRASNDTEKATVAAFRSAYSPYAASREVWTQKIQFGSLMGGKVPCGVSRNPQCHDWITTYGLKPIDHTPAPNPKAKKLAAPDPLAPYYDPAEIMQALWSIADQRMVKAIDSYMGRKSEKDTAQ